MSINILILNDDLIIFGTDRRACMIENRQVKDLCTELVFYFNGDRKSYFFAPPHNFVGFSINGWEPIQINELLPDLVQTLPDRRLEIKEYAERISTFMAARMAPSKTSLNDQDKILNFNVAGFNEGQSGRKYFHFELPNNPIPQEISTVIRFEGKAEHLGATQSEFLNKMQTKLGRKKFSNLTQIEKKILKKAREGKDLFKNTPTHDAVKYVEFLIDFISEEQSKRGEILSVGGGADIFTISPIDGVKVISYGAKEHVMCESILAQHFVSIECCEKNKIQIDFERPVENGYKAFPSNSIFKCGNCFVEVDLTKVKERFLSKS